MNIIYESGVCTVEILKGMDMGELIRLHNRMVDDGLAAGLDKDRYKHVENFTSQEAAIKKVQTVHSSVVAAKSQGEVPSSRLKLPLDAKIKLLVNNNPKRGEARKRFDIYHNGMTVGEYIETVGKKYARDILWDREHQFIDFE